MKKSNSSLLIISMFILIWQNSYSQNFQKSFYKTLYDLNHFNLEVIDDGSGGETTFISGTKFNGNATEGIVAKIDNLGNLVWQKTISDNINPSNNIRILDLAIDPTEEIIAVTGFTSSAINNSNLLFLTLDYYGNVLSEKILTMQHPISVGSNIIYSHNEDLFIIGGFINETGQNLLQNNSENDVEYGPILPYPCDYIGSLLTSKDIIFKISKLGNLLSSIYTFGSQPSSSINDIVETSNGYFIVGAEKCGAEVLAIDLDINLSPISDYSFTNSNRDHRGASVAYNSNDDVVYILSNSSYSHSPYVTSINLTTQTTLDNYRINLLTDSSQLNFAGFQIKYNSNANKIVLAGYKRKLAYLKTPNLHSGITWITSMNINVGGSIDPTNIEYNLYDAPVGNFYFHGGGYFSTFLQEAPNLFSQEILHSSFKNGQLRFKLFAPREINGSYYGIDLISEVVPSQGGTINSCAYVGEIDMISQNRPSSKFIEANIIIGSTINRFYSVNNFNFDVDNFCTSYSPLNRLKQSNQTLNDITDFSNFKIYPNPSNGSFSIFINSNELETIHYEILDLNGKIVHSKTQMIKSKIQINTEYLNKGIYILKVNSPSFFETRRIVLF